MSDDAFRQLVERRRYCRVRRHVDVGLRIVDTHQTAERTAAADISVGGVRLKVQRDLPQGSRLGVTLYDRRSDLDMVLRGTVVWRAWNAQEKCFDVGVRFDHLATDQHRNLLALIGLESGPHGAERRHFVRLDADLSARLAPADEPGAEPAELRVTDMGPGGMAGVCASALRTGVIYLAEIALPGGKEPVRMRAEALGSRRRAGGRLMTRFRFLGIEPDARRRIAKFLGRLVQQSIRPKG